MNDTLTLRVTDLLRAGVGAEMSEDLKLPEGDYDELSLRHGHVHVDLQRIDTGILATLKGEGTVQLVCDRCLEPYELSLPVSSREEFREGTLGEESWPITRDGMIDVVPPVRQALLLEVPTHPLCREDCPGLCLVCGQPLGDGHQHQDTSNEGKE